MILVKVKRSAHGKSAYAEYKDVGYSLRVYIYHNKPCTKEYGEWFLVCHQTEKGEREQRIVFDNYLDFRNFRSEKDIELNYDEKASGV